jgi:hypothetical protein
MTQVNVLGRESTLATKSTWRTYKNRCTFWTKALRLFVADRIFSFVGLKLAHGSFIHICFWVCVYVRMYMHVGYHSI